MKQKPLPVTIFVLNSLLLILIAILVNYATSTIPPIVKPLMPVIWPLVGICSLVEVTLGVILLRRQSSDERSIATGNAYHRERLLEKVYDFWINGVLEQSLYGAAFIELGLSEQPDAVEKSEPWRFVLEQPDQPPLLLPPNTHITQVYDEACGELLILGEPGSGKTTLLLQLARDLLKRARNDTSCPIPIVFNLSSWVATVKGKSLEEWLVQELYSKYQTPWAFGQKLILLDQLLPLLDGLDEVAPKYRESCIEAINIYHNNHGLVPIVICSRKTEYFALQKRVFLRTAVVVQPLTMEQIEEYLTSGGEQLAAVLEALHHDPDLQGMATTPLMLSVLALAYRGSPVQDLVTKNLPEVRQRQVFTQYIESMLKRKGESRHYTPQQTRHWLSCLARGMVQHSQTVFYVERMQSDWLPNRVLHLLYNGLIGGLVFGLVFGLVSGLVIGLISGIALGLVFGFIGMLHADERFADVAVTPVNMPEALLHWLSGGLLFGLPTGLVSGLAIGLLDGPPIGLLCGLIFGLYFVLLGGLFSGGAAWIARMVLLAFLRQAGFVPWNYSHFLDYAANLLLLRKVGGGYIFVHRLLLDHFAELNESSFPAGSSTQNNQVAAQEDSSFQVVSSSDITEPETSKPIIDDMSEQNTAQLMWEIHLLQQAAPKTSLGVPNSGNYGSEERDWPYSSQETDPMPVINLSGREPFGRTSSQIPAIGTHVKLWSAWKAFFNSSAARIGISLVVGAGLLFLVVQSVDWPTIAQILRQTLTKPSGIGRALLSGVVFLLAFSIRGVRWKLFLNPIGKLSTFTTIQLFMIGIFLNFLLPIRGGEVAKSLLLKRLTTKPERTIFPISRSLPTVAMDKSLDLMPALIIMATAPFIPGIRMSASLWVILGLVSAILLGMIFTIALMAWNRTAATKSIRMMLQILPGSIGGKIEGFALGFVDALLTGASQPGIFLAVLLTIVAVVLDGLFAMLAFWTIGFPITFGVAIFGYTVYNMYFIFPTPPGQVGSNEAIGLLVFTGLLHLPASTVLAVFIFAHLWSGLLMCTTGLACFSALGFNVFNALRVQTESENTLLPLKQDQR